MNNYGYVYTYFRWKGVAKDMQYIYLALSKDGLHFTPLNNNEPILKSTIGTLAVRDPQLIRSEIDGAFYLIATDLDVNKNQWKKYKTRGSKCICMWKSTDMIHWSEQYHPQVIDEDLGCIWAPKVCYDEDAKEYVMAFSTQPAGSKDMCVYYTRTKDFEHFTKAQVLVPNRPNETHEKWAWFVPYHKNLSFIDSTTVKIDGNYYRFTKNETLHTIQLETSEQITENYSLTKELVANERGVEGPCVYKLAGQDKYVLLMDGYSAPNANVGYFPCIASTEDLKIGNFRRLSSDEFSFPEGCKHGGVLAISEDEYKALERHYNIISRNHK